MHEVFFSASYPRIYPRFTAGKRTGVWNCQRKPQTSENDHLHTYRLCSRTSAAMHFSWFPLFPAFWTVSSRSNCSFSTAFRQSFQPRTMNVKKKTVTQIQPRGRKLRMNAGDETRNMYVARKPAKAWASQSSSSVALYVRYCFVFLYILPVAYTQKETVYYGTAHE